MPERSTENDLKSWVTNNLPKIADDARKRIIRCRDDGQLYSAVIGMSLAVKSDVEFPDYQIDNFVKIATDLDWTSESIREVEHGLSQGRRGAMPGQ